MRAGQHHTAEQALVPHMVHQWVAQRFDPVGQVFAQKVGSGDQILVGDGLHDRQGRRSAHRVAAERTAAVHARSHQVGCRADGQARADRQASAQPFAKVTTSGTTPSR